MNERLKIFVEYLAISNIDFAESIGVSRQQYEGWINQNVKVPVHCLIQIAQVYKEINTRWLLTGEGIMLVREGVGEGVKEVTGQLTELSGKGRSATKSYLKYGEFENCEQLKNELLIIKGKYIQLLEKVISEKGIADFKEKRIGIGKIDGFKMGDKNLEHIK